MWRPAAKVALALLVSLALPSLAFADGAGTGRLFVPGDHFDPGDTLDISGTEFDPGAQLVIRLVSGTSSAELGTVTVADDRTLIVTAAVPAGFPTGYAELTATDSSGRTWSTFVLIGSRPEGQPGGAQLDERAWWLAVLAGGVAIMSIALLQYRRARSQGAAESQPYAPGRTE